MTSYIAQKMMQTGRDTILFYILLNFLYIQGLVMKPFFDYALNAQLESCLQ